MKLNDTNIKLMDVTYRLIEKTMFKPNIHSKNNNDIDKKMMKFRPNEKISFKEVFGNKKYSTKEYYDEYLDYLRVPGNIEVAADEQIEFLNLVMFEFAPTPELLKVNIDNLVKSLYWASESIYDFAEIFTMFAQESINDNNNRLQFKMMFKEFYSLIDRLRVEASIEISTRNMGLKRENYTPEVMESTNFWRSRLPQDLILNGDATKLSKSIAYIKKFKVDDEGWVTFEYGDMDNVLSPYKNEIFNLVRRVRNEYEHSFNNRLFQQYYESGQLNYEDPDQVKNSKVVEIFKSKCYLTMIVYFYHLFKISEMYKESLF